MSRVTLRYARYLLAALTSVAFLFGDGNTEN